MTILILFIFSSFSDSAFHDIVQHNMYIADNCKFSYYAL